MTDRATCKLGLVLPDDLHRRMIAGATTSLAATAARGGVQRAYEQAFEDLLQALDAGEETAFAAVRGAKVKVTVRLPEDLCGRIRRRLEMPATEAHRFYLRRGPARPYPHPRRLTWPKRRRPPSPCRASTGRRKLLDLRLRLKGKAAVELADYQRAYAATTGEPVEAEALVLHILTAFIDADRGFQAWRKANPAPESRA